MSLTHAFSPTHSLTHVAILLKLPSLSYSSSSSSTPAHNRNTPPHHHQNPKHAAAGIDVYKYIPPSTSTSTGTYN
ncbi:hypothetical protein EX30DRAFT_344687, partial [Ascodesmis nigricans]